MERSITDKYPPKFRDEFDELEYFKKYRLRLHEWLLTITPNTMAYQRMSNEIGKIDQRISILEVNQKIRLAIIEYKEPFEPTIADWGKAG